jgi:hypothetical protein
MLLLEAVLLSTGDSRMVVCCFLYEGRGPAWIVTTASSPSVIDVILTVQGAFCKKITPMDHAGSGSRRDGMFDLRVTLMLMLPQNISVRLAV